MGVSPMSECWDTARTAVLKGRLERQLMSDLWIKIKFWIKTTLISVLVIYVALFIFKNVSEKVKFWYFPLQDSIQTSVLYLSASAFVAGVLTAILVKTTLTTIKQFRLMKAVKAQKELAEMQAKAARLQTKGAAPAHAVESEPSAKNSGGI